MNDLAINLTRHVAINEVRRCGQVPLELLGWLLWSVDIGVIALVAAGLKIDHRITVVTLLLYPSFAALSGAYDTDSLFSMRGTLPRILRSWGASVLFTLSFQIVLNSQIPIVPMHVTEWLFITVFALVAMRSITTHALAQLRAAGFFNQRLAIYGATIAGADLYRHIVAHPSLTLDIVGVYDERRTARLHDEARGLPVRGDIDQLVHDIREGQIDQVIIALPWSEDIYVRNIINRLTLTPVRIRLMPDFGLSANPQQRMVMLGDIPMMTLFERPISGIDAVVKRIEDLALVIPLAVLAAPILLVTAFAIKLDSPGPIFFRQPREGFNNQRFRIWKFRSMHTDVGTTTAVQQATRADPRITRVGRFIRATSIDELPQLINVLAGEMSIVGPRPHAPSTRAGGVMFPNIINTYAARHKVKPGITGWAQVCGWRGETDTEDKLINRVNHDLYYIEHWSVWLDVYIMLRTAFVLVGNNVY